MGDYVRIIKSNLPKRSWNSLFHLKEETIEEIYQKYCKDDHITRKELIMTLNFLVCYLPGDIMHLSWGIYKEKWRRIVWKVIKHLDSKMNEINIEDRFEYMDSRGMFACVTLLWDTTEVYINSPKNKIKNLMYLSGKKRRHTIKYDIASKLIDGKICYIGNQSPGRMADITIYRNSELPDILEEGEVIIADKALQGIHNAMVPFSSPSNLSEELFNYRVDSKRALIEQVNARLKKFKVMSSVWRHDIKLHDIVANVVANIYNISIKYSPLTEH